MERYCRRFRDSGGNNDSKVGAPWRHGYGCPGGGGGGGGGDPRIPGGFSWPPRSYTCSFCRREFKSAQALGGHMNVHRRDRARLRQSPPWDPLPSPNPNPNRKGNPSPKPRTDPVPNLNNPPPSHANTESTRISPAGYTFSSLVSPLARLSSSSSSTASEEPLKAPRAGFGVGELKVFMAEDTGNALSEAREVVRLDLEMAMCGDLKEDLDLELRLGYT